VSRRGVALLFVPLGCVRFFAKWAWAWLFLRYLLLKPSRPQTAYPIPSFE
jgi:hypothetical protein